MQNSESVAFPPLDWIPCPYGFSGLCECQVVGAPIDCRTALAMDQKIGGSIDVADRTRFGKASCRAGAEPRPHRALAGAEVRVEQGRQRGRPQPDQMLVGELAIRRLTEREMRKLRCTCAWISGGDNCRPREKFVARAA